MQINEASILVTILWSSGMILVIHLLRKRIRTSGSGIKIFLLLAAACIFRVVFPIELPPLEYISVRAIYNPVFLWTHEKLLSGGRLSFTIGQLLLLLWGLVAAVLLVRYGYLYFHSMQGLRMTSKQEEELSHILELVQSGESKKDRNSRNNRNKTGRNRTGRKQENIRVVRNPYIDTPISAGILHSYIVIPEKTSGQDVFLMVKHEFTHIKSGDLILKLLLNVLCCIFWWNPFIYLLRRDMEQTLELHCDKAVTDDMAEEERAKYLEMILAVFSQSGRSDKQNRNYLYLFGDREAMNLKERFEAVEAATRKELRKNDKHIPEVLVTVLLLAISYLFSSKQYQAAFWELDGIMIAYPQGNISWQDKERLLENYMQRYDVDGDYVDPVTGIAGMLANNIPIEERHRIIKISAEAREMMFDETKRHFLLEYGVANGDTTRRSEVFRSYQLSVPKADRLKGTWTLGQYERQYRKAFYNAVKEADPSWELGKPFSRRVLDNITREKIDSAIVSDGVKLSTQKIDFTV